jgi:NitT/TauT family transport system substrate-binding protein
MLMSPKRIIALTIVLAGVAGFCQAASAANTELRMILNWKWQGPQGWFLLAQDRGYFAEEGIDIVMDQGNGSGAAVPKVASRQYDVGFGDINALIELSATKPELAPVAVYMMYNIPPFAVIVRTDSPIQSPKDFEGHTIGGSANDAVRKLFPAFCGAVKLDCSKVDILTVQPGLYEQMLMRKQVDAVFGYVNTVRFSAKLMNVDPDKELRFIKFADYGLDLYSNALIVSRELAREKPKVVKGFVRAVNRGVIAALKDPEAAVEAVRKREPLINSKIELERLVATVTDEMSHPEIARVGFGNVDRMRLRRSIDFIVRALDLGRTPAPDEIFDPAFLPPETEQLRKLDLGHTGG